MDAVKNLVNDLANFPRFENVFNQWCDYDRLHDFGPEAPEIRQAQLYQYFAERVGRAKYILCAEAAGYLGAKFTGIAMTDERVLTGHKPSAPFPVNEILGIAGKRTSNAAATTHHGGMNEMTASVLYSFLYQSGISPFDVVTWNSFPFHPHNAASPLSNRKPSDIEVRAASHLQDQFFEIFSDCHVIAVGNVSADMLSSRGISFQKARHPANGGAGKFRSNMTDILGANARQLELSA